MSAMSRCLLAASQQFMLAASPAILNPRIQSMVLAGAMLLSTGFSPEASAQSPGYVWGNGGTSSSGGRSDQAVLPEGSAGRWGGVIGGALGRAIGGAAAGSAASTEVGRRLQDAVGGTSQEVGQNLGRSVAQQPYKNANMPSTIESDHLDTVGLNAIFANGRAAHLVAVARGTVELRQAQDQRERTMREFDLAYRAVSGRGFNVGPWSEIRLMLQRPLGATAEAQLVAQGEVMARRLNRAGGPGYQVPATYPSPARNTLENLRIMAYSQQNGSVAVNDLTESPR